MPANIYELVAQGARYWFLFLMALVVWRSWRWYRKDQKQAKKRLKLLPDAGFVGEMVVIRGGKTLHPGDVLAVPWEGTLGSLRTNDLCLVEKGVARRHLWFRYDDRKGLMVEPFGQNKVNVDGEDFLSRRDPLYMAHGSRLYVGDMELRLRLFAGFETVGYAQRQSGVEAEPSAPEPQPQAEPFDQAAAMQQLWLQQQWMMQQQAYEQGYRQAMQQLQDDPAPEPVAAPYSEDSLPFDMAQIAQEEGMVDHRMFMRPEGVKKPQLPVYEPEEPAPEQMDFAPAERFYPPEMDDAAQEDEGAEEWFSFDEDMTDAASLPRSAYVGHDDAALAKKHLWDKYFRGGDAR